MLQAPVFDSLAFDPFPFQQNDVATSEVDVGGCEIVEALVIALMIVVRDEGFDLGLEIAGQVIVLKQDAVLQGLMPALDLALGLGMVGGATDMLHAPVIQPFSQVAGDIAGSIIRQQPRLVSDRRLITA